MTHENGIKESKVGHYTNSIKNNPNRKSEFLETGEFIRQHQSCQQENKEEGCDGRSRSVIKDSIDR